MNQNSFLRNISVIAPEKKEIVPSNQLTKRSIASEVRVAWLKFKRIWEAGAVSFVQHQKNSKYSTVRVQNSTRQLGKGKPIFI